MTFIEKIIHESEVYSIIVTKGFIKANYVTYSKKIILDRVFADLADDIKSIYINKRTNYNLYYTHYSLISILNIECKSLKCTLVISLNPKINLSQFNT